MKARPQPGTAKAGRHAFSVRSNFLTIRPIKPFRFELEHRQLLELIICFENERLTHEELASCVDCYCGCGMKHHQLSALLKMRLRLEGDLQTGMLEATDSESELRKRTESQRTARSNRISRLRASRAQQAARACIECQNQLTPELTPRLKGSSAPERINERNGTKTFANYSKK